MNGIEYKFALVVEADILPVSFPNTQTKIEKLHITLIGGKYLKQHKAVLKTFDFSISSICMDILFLLLLYRLRHIHLTWFAK